MVPQDATIAVNRLRTNVKELNGVGDLQALATAVEQIIPAIEDGRGAYEAKKLAEKALKAAQRETALAVKEKIVTEAQSLALSESWKTTGDRLKVLLDEWKVAPRLDKKTDAEMWKKFSSSRNKFDKRRRTHFATLDAAQNKVAEAKNAIVTEAESLATSKDWVATARRFKALMDLWKASGRGKKNEDAKLWARFKIAQDQFFASKNADLEKREESMKANLEKRDALITQIEALLPISNAETASKAFREFARQWDKIGMTQREKRAALDTRFAAVETQIKAAQEVQWRKTDPVAKSRANDVVRQLEEAVGNYEKQAEKAQASGNAKKAAEALAAVEARRQWLADAVKGLEEFTS